MLPDVPPVAGERTWTIWACPECGRKDNQPTSCYGETRPPHKRIARVRVEVVSLSRLRAVEEERDRWVRLFNRLDAAISHHRKAKNPEGHDFVSWADDTDDALHVAHDRILKEAASGR